MNLSKNQIVIVTGLSGAGRTTALKIFEDFGYEAVDNLPCSILGTLINKGVKNKIAIGIDIRSRDFNGKTINEANPSTPVEILGMNESANAGDEFSVVNSEEEAKQFYEYVQQWGAALINELDTRNKLSLVDSNNSFDDE